MPMYNFTVSITVQSDEPIDVAESMLEGVLDGLTDGDIFGCCIEGGEEV